MTISQMTAEIRRAQHVQCASSGATYVDVYRTAANLTANESYRRFSYSAASSQITLTIYRTDGTSSGPYVMASNVSAAAFGPPVLGTNSQGQSQVQRLPVSITVTVKGNSVNLRGSGTTRCDLAA